MVGLMACRSKALCAGTVLMLMVASVSLGGCKTVELVPEASAADGDVVATGTVAAPLDISAVPPPVDPFQRGLYYFNRGDYGLAEKNFRDTVEKTPNNTGAWIALAASYDNIRRFAFADRAYATAVRLAGETPQILNNQALSYMLRGDLPRARAKLMRALKLDPHNVVARNNLRLVDARIADRRHPPYVLPCAPNRC